MWLIVMFDLPMRTKEERRHYRAFVNLLKRKGFKREQLSIYARHYDSVEIAESAKKSIMPSHIVSATGIISILTIADKAISRLVSVDDKGFKQGREKPQQLIFF